MAQVDYDVVVVVGGLPARQPQKQHKMLYP